MMIIRIWFEYCRVENASRVRLQTRSSYEAGKRAHRVLNSITSNSNKQVKTTSPIVMREHMQLIHQAFIKSDMSLSSVMHKHLSHFFFLRLSLSHKRNIFFGALNVLIIGWVFSINSFLYFENVTGSNGVFHFFLLLHFPVEVYTKASSAFTSLSLKWPEW